MWIMEGGGFLFSSFENSGYIIMKARNYDYVYWNINSNIAFTEYILQSWSNWLLWSFIKRR